jgi:hypothetical protein
MKKLAVYGLLTGLAVAGWTYLEYLFGWHTNTVGRYSGLLAIVFPAIGIITGIRAYRDQDKGGVITYWEAVLAGVVITAIAGLIVACFTYLYYTSIHPGLVDFLVEKKRQALTERQATAAQITAQLRQVRDYHRPLTLTLRSLGGFMGFGLITSLILAAVLKKYPQE